MYLFKRAAAVGVAVLMALSVAMPDIGSVPAAAQDEVFDPAAFGFTLTPVATGLDRPLFVADPDDGSGRLFIVEQGGTIRILRDGDLEPEPFLDVSGLITTRNSEQGLLGLAFEPDFAETGRFYIGYTANTGQGAGDNTIARLSVLENDPDQADLSSLEVLIAIADPFGNHNGGQVSFGPDGFLYAGTGDGGGGGDPENNAQNPQTLLGNILRIDVSGETGYEIPDDNPFADGVEGRPEIWAWGLRNPWRFSFDRETDDLWIADVGQNWIEEINLLPAGSPGGANFGWPVMEGTTCFREQDCSAEGFVLPVAEYTHEEGCSVTGGYVYRGKEIPELDGVYLFGDFCFGSVWGLGQDASGEWVRSLPVATDLNISSFAEDAAGGLYITAFNGVVYRIDPIAS
jgi:glucose/arabinose dehydrogenase